MRTLALVLLGVFLLVPRSHAALVTYHFDGVVTDVSNSGFFELMTIDPGDAFAGEFVVDTSVMNITPDSSVAVFENALVNVSIQIGGFNVFEIFDFPAFSSVGNTANGSSLFLANAQLNSNLIDSLRANLLDMRFGDSTMQLFGDGMLPASLSGIDSARGGINFGTNSNTFESYVAFDITQINSSPVPVPAAFWLLLGGLSALGLGLNRPA